MLTLEVIRRRRSCRDMHAGRVDPFDLQRFVDAGAAAPSAHNTQNVRFAVLPTHERMEQLAEHKTPSPLIRRASAGIVVFVDESLHKCPEHERYIWSLTWPQNAAAAVQNILLAATALKYATLWISWVPPMDGTRLLYGGTVHDALPEFDIPDNLTPQALVLIGHTDAVDEMGCAKGDERHGRHPVKRAWTGSYMVKERS